MTFSELVDGICLEVNRPDFTFESDGGDGRAVAAALASLRYLHLRDFYVRDIKTAVLSFDSAAYIQLVDFSALPNFRSLAYIRKWDPTYSTSQQNPSTSPPGNASTALGFLREIKPPNIFDEFGLEQSDVYYMAGDTVYIKSSTSISQAFIGYYAVPTFQPGNDGRYSSLNSWIAASYPDAVIYHAASKLYASIGMQDKARTYDSPPNPRTGYEGGLVAQQLRLIDISNVTGVGS